MFPADQPSLSSDRRVKGAVAFVGLWFDQLDARQLAGVVATADPTRFRYLVTPNVDHIVRLHRSSIGDRSLVPAYKSADWCACDSRVIARLARARGATVVVAPGSDVTRALLERLEATSDRRRVAVVGLDPAGMSSLAKRYPATNFQHIPAPYGLAGDAAARTEVCSRIIASSPALILLAVGSPQQEMIAYELFQRSGSRGTALCIGASLDFLIGREQRAPRMLQQAGLEWAFRLVHNPRRLWRRYLIDGLAIFSIAWRSKPVVLPQRVATSLDDVANG